MLPTLLPDVQSLWGWSVSKDQGQHCNDFASLTEVAYVSQLASGRPLALQACANMLWALGVLGSANNATVMRIVQFMSQKDCGELLSTQYHQLFQVQQICFEVNVCNTCIQSHSAVQYHLSIYCCCARSQQHCLVQSLKLVISLFCFIFYSSPWRFTAEIMLYKTKCSVVQNLLACTLLECIAPQPGNTQSFCVKLGTLNRSATIIAVIKK